MPDFYSLPVYAHKEEVLKALEENQVIIVESPTGSGKTTQLPLILREAGYDKSGIIGITQPRRIATLSVSEFIKRQIGDEDGSYCAYTMRFADTSTPETKIKNMTDGILLQEVKADPLLSQYSVIMVDEAHERSLNIDFILGLLKNIIKERDDLKIIISSATINTITFSKFFFDAPVISISGKPYHVELKYDNIILNRDKEEEYYGHIVDLVKASVENKDGGDILIFLPGEAEIKNCLAYLNMSSIAKSLQIYPLFGRLSKEEQERVFTPTEEGKRKVVVATNIAETSITIDGIRTVIDSGLAKINIYNQRNFTSALLPIPISRASADQRKGRAGRTNSGVCIRLYSEESYIKRPEFSEEEILHSDLAEVVLRMSELGIFDSENFPFITPPKKSALKSAEETLITIGAIEENHHLTHIGEMMIKFPLIPRLSRVIVEAILNYPEVLNNVLIAVSFLSTKSPYVLPPGEEMNARNVHQSMQDPVYGDFVAMLTLYNRYIKLNRKERERFTKSHYLDIETMEEVIHIKGQLEELVSHEGIPVLEGGTIKSYFLALASGLRQYVCKKVDRWSYKSVAADQILIHPGSTYFRRLPEYILAGEIVKTTKMYARTCSPLKAEWLKELDPAILESLNKSKAERDRDEEKKASAKLEQYKTKHDGKIMTIIPYNALLSLRIPDKAKFYISINGIVSSNEHRSADLKALRVLLSGKNPLRNLPKAKVKPYEKDYKSLDALLIHILSTYVKKNRDRYTYLALHESKGTYFLASVASFQNAVNDSIQSLTRLMEVMPKSEGKKYAHTAKKLKMLEEALDLRED